MRLLLDTHSFLWFIAGSPALSQNARSLIEDSSNEVFLSICSLWEMAIKLSIGKLNLAQPFEVLIPEQMSLNRIELLPIEIGHTLLITRLPFHHRDPFDRCNRELDYEIAWTEFERRSRQEGTDCYGS